MCQGVDEREDERIWFAPHSRRPTGGPAKAHRIDTGRRHFTPQHHRPHGEGSRPREGKTSQAPGERRSVRRKPAPAARSQRALAAAGHLQAKPVALLHPGEWKGRAVAPVHHPSGGCKGCHRLAPRPDSTLTPVAAPQGGGDTLTSTCHQGRRRDTHTPPEGHHLPPGLPERSLALAHQSVG